MNKCSPTESQTIAQTLGQSSILQSLTSKDPVVSVPNTGAGVEDLVCKILSGHAKSCPSSPGCCGINKIVPSEKSGVLGG